MRLRFLLLIVLMIVLAACSPSADVPDSVSEVQDTLEPAATAVASAVSTVLTPASGLSCESLPEVTTEGENGVTVPGNAVAVFQKTGGFAGVMETTVIYADGHIENNQNESYQAPPQVVGTLVSTAEDIGFFGMDGNYVPENHCCDYFTYSLTIRNCEQVNTVVTADEAPGTPAELWQIINTIQTLIDNTSAAVPPQGTVDLEEIVTPDATTDGEEEFITIPAPGTPG